MTTPPLLMLAEGRRPRARRAPTMRPKEIALHKDVERLLRAHARPEWQWCHIPNGEARDPRTAAKLKQMGVRPGMPDFALFDPSGLLHALELKRQGETLSEAQEQFKFWCIRSGVQYAITYNMRDVFIAFGAWNCLDADAARLVGGAHE